MSLSEYGFRSARAGEIEERVTGRHSRISPIIFESFMALSDEARACGVVREHADKDSAHRLYVTLRHYRSQHPEYESVGVHILGNTVFLVERDAK